MTRTTIMLPEDLKARVSKIAHLKGMTLGQLIRESLNHVIEDVGAKAESDPFWSDRSVFKDAGPADAAKNHDAYLYGNKP